MLEQVQDEEIRIGLEIDEQRKASLMKLSEDSKILERAIAKSLRRQHSTREIEDYLRKRSVSPELTQEIVGRLVKLNLLDDARFAEYWVESRKRSGRSNRYIQGELRAKGVSQAIVDKVLADTSGDGDALAALISKKAKQYDNEQKLIQYLMRKGFGYSEIKIALAEQDD